MKCTTRLTADGFDATTEFALFQSGLEIEGAIVTFFGIARPQTAAGEKVSALFLDHHPRLTEATLDAIAQDAGERFNVSSIHIVHRCGRIVPGEPIVFVAAAALHRRAAFEAAEYAMDRLKTDAVFWKREDTVDGSRWIEPTIADHADRARWSK
jgi:molybdopterin synthase catalytic subunit